MTSDELAAIKARVEAATAGPWMIPRYYPYIVALTEDVPIPKPRLWWHVDIVGNGQKRAQNDADLEFIAHARQDIPALLAEVERLQTAHGVYSATVAQVTALQAEVKWLQVLNANLAYQCRIVLDQWPEFELDMSLPVGSQLWRKATEKYLAQLSEKPA